jgi:hypothetical protein
MAGIHSYNVIGHPQAESERRAKQLSAGLEAESPGRREHTLLALAKLWFPLSSCLNAQPPHAMPTPALLEAVARCVDEEQKDSVRLAAIVATGAGWRAFRVVRAKSPSEVSSRHVPMASIAAIRDALSATSNVLRINAARLLAEFPMAEVLPQLRTVLLDDIWTVRWNAVRAIAALGSDESLIEVLRQSQPRERSNVVAHDFCLAVEALRASGLSLPHELLQYDEPD